MLNTIARPRYAKISADRRSDSVGIFARAYEMTDFNYYFLVINPIPAADLEEGGESIKIRKKKNSRTRTRELRFNHENRFSQTVLVKIRIDCRPK